MSPVAAALDPYEQEQLLDQKLPTVVRKRLAFLRPPDRALIELVLIRQLTRSQIARLLDCPTGTITRRLQRLGRRLHDPLVNDLLDDDCSLSPRTRQIAIDRFLNGDSIADISRRHRIGRTTVTRALDFVRGWHQRRRN